MFDPVAVAGAFWLAWKEVEVLVFQVKEIKDKFPAFWLTMRESIFALVA